MFKNPRWVFLLLVLLTAILTAMDLPEQYQLKFLHKRFQTHLGLDLSGGTHLSLEADMKDIVETDRGEALEGAKEVIERRVNLFGVSEPIVQSAISGDSFRVIVELPGVTDVDDAIRLIGQTAKLEFREFTDEKDATPGAFVIPQVSNTKSTGLTGKDLKRAQMTFSTQTGEPEVSLEFSGEGGKKFADITRRLIGKPLPIFLDNFPVTWPKVNTEMSSGQRLVRNRFQEALARGLSVFRLLLCL